MDSTLFNLEVWKLGVTTLISVVAGGYGIGIARRQAITAKEARDVAAAKLNFDLFKDRLVIYRQTREFLKHMCYRLNEMSLPMMNELIEKIPEASFLFGSDIETFLNEIVQEATKYNALQQLQVSNSYLFNDAAKAEHEARRLWFVAKMGEHRKMFEVYMDFSKWRG